MSLTNLVYSSFFGQLVWLKETNGQPAGKVAGSLNAKGYRCLRINGENKIISRLIWEIHHGPIPEGIEIDHRNGNRDCNYIWNLRLATRNQNMHNRKLNSNNTSGIKGVSWHKRDRYWVARVAINGKTYRKHFKCKDQAVEWIQNKRKELHGKFTNHGT